MRKLVLILIAFIAVVTFIRAFDNSTKIYPNPGEAAGNPVELFGTINDFE